jgi:hypothetical protein
MKIVLASQRTQRELSKTYPDTMISVFVGSGLAKKMTFRCLNCGLALFLLEHEVSMLIPSGDHPVLEKMFDVECPRCQLKYRLLW